jgi:hypothetical protein
MCKKACGCPVDNLPGFEGIASDLELNQFLTKFQQARGLFEMNNVESLLIRAYEELDLIDDPDLLFNLEKYFREGMNKRAKEESKK